MTEGIRVGAIVGPTAAGKTEVAIEVAERLGAEIVSMDSMQAYRGMDVGTAKPSPEQIVRIRHHLVDVFDPNEDVTVAQFQELGRAAIADISSRGRLPLLVGGSGLYFRSVVDDLRFPPRSETVRTALEQEAEELGADALYERLRQLDPPAAGKMEPGNARRIVRALEVIELTGRPFSENNSWDDYSSPYDLRVAGLERPREELYERIARRVDRMLQEGLLSEVRALQQRGFGRTAGRALGYRQVLDAAPGDSLHKVREEIVRATKRFARRQESWFRADPRVRWFDASDSGLVERIAVHLAP